MIGGVSRIAQANTYRSSSFGSLLWFGLLASLVLGLWWPSAAAAQTVIDFEEFNGPCCFSKIEPPLTVGIATFSGGQLLRNTSNLPADPSTVYGTSTYCAGCLSELSIAFSSPIDNFSLRVINGNTVTVTYTVLDDRGGTQQIVLVKNTSSGAGRVSLPSKNIQAVTIKAGPAPGGCCGWDFFIDDVMFDLGCRVSVVRQTQYDPAWANDLYDHSPSKTMRNLGCAVSTLSMALNSAGMSVTPGSLNKFMTATTGDFNGLSVNWGAATRDVSGQALLKFHGKRLSGQLGVDYLNAQLCTEGHPVIVGVDLDSDGAPGHFVIVTGKSGDDFEIADPGYNRSKLSDYGEFETRGFVADPPGDISELNVAISDGADFLITNPSGNRTGIDPFTGGVIQEISDSNYFRDALVDDETNSRPDELARTAIVPTPIQGLYQIGVVGKTLGVNTLTVRVFSADGSPQPALSLLLITSVGSTSSLLVKVVPDGSAGPVLQRAGTFDEAIKAVSDSAVLGLIDSRGVAESLNQKLRAAARATGISRTNVLEAFRNELAAQTGKHVDASIAPVLLDIANSIREP